MKPSAALDLKRARMSANRLTDYLSHIRQAATEACGFTKSLSKEEFCADKRIY